MGKRKSKAKPPPKKKMPKLETTFSCPFCNHSNSVECLIDRKNSVAEASCTICMAMFNTSAHVLTDPIDVYTEWLDECERINNNEDDDN